MKVRTSHYPIGALLIQILHDSKLTLEPFVRAIGYGNPSKGVRAFDHIITFGEPVPVFINRLATSPFAPDPTLLKQALDKSKVLVAQRLDQERTARMKAEAQAFRPFLQGVPEYTTPTSITFFCLTGGHSRYTIPVPEDLPSWDLKEQHRYINEVVQKHYSSSNGLTLYMGRITGYRLFRRYGEPAVFYTITGEPLGLQNTPPLPDGHLSIGGRTLTPAQLRSLIKLDS